MKEKYKYQIQMNSRVVDDMKISDDCECNAH